MRHRDYFHRTGLAVMLFTAGVLGGLLAPSTSNAQTPTASRPTLAIEVIFNGTSTGSLPIPVNPTPVACTSTSFNYCYALDATAYTTYYGPVGHQFVIQNYSGTAPARVNVNDVSTSGSTNPADVIVVTGMRIAPYNPGSWGSFDNVVVQLTVENKFDAQPNPAANGSTSFYPFGMSVGGTFATSPSPAGNFYQMFGRGVFETTGSPPIPASGQPKNIANQFNPHADFSVTQGSSDNRCYGTPLSAGGTKYPLCQYIAGATSTQASFSSQQNSSYYPGGSTSLDTSTRFRCTNNLTGNNKQVVDPRGTTRTYNDPSCQPKITETHKFSLWGPDTIIFTTSSHGGGGVCSDESGSGPPLPSCLCTTTNKPNKASVCNAIKSLHQKAKSDEDIENNITGAQPAIECDGVICSGILNLIINVTDSPPVGTVFPFKVQGPGGGEFTITTTANGTGILNPPLDHLITGRGGAEGGPAPLAILPDYDNPAWPRPNANSYYEVDQFQVGSLNGSTIPGTDTEIISCPGGHKGPVLINAIGRNSVGQGDTVTVGVHIHKAQSPPAVCPF